MVSITRSSCPCMMLALVRVPASGFGPIAFHVCDEALHLPGNEMPFWRAVAEFVGVVRLRSWARGLLGLM